MTDQWCDEKYPELASEVRNLWYWIAQHGSQTPKDRSIDSGEMIDRSLEEIIMKVKGEL